MKTNTNTRNHFSIKICFFIPLLFMGFLTKSQIYNWAFNPSNTQNDRANSIKCDASGNSYVVGQFFGTIDIDPGAGVTNLISAGDRDFYVAKYDINKNLVWGFRIGGTTADIATAVSLDVSGNVYVVGTFGNTVDFDPGASTANVVASGINLNSFLVKYSNSGAFVFASNIGFGGSSTATDIEFDGSSVCYITGWFSSTIDLNPSAGTNTVSATNPQAYFVSRFTNTGGFLNGFKLDVTFSSGLTYPTIAPLPSGDFYLTGSFASTTDFDPGAPVVNISSSGQSDVFLAKYAPNGAYSWAFKVGSAGYDIGNHVTADLLGNAYITGCFTGSVDFDPGASTFSLTAAASNEDPFVAKYSSTGALVWAFSYPGVQSAEEGKSLALDASNNIYVTGFFNTMNVDFDPGPGINLLSAANGIDVFVAKYSSAGNFVWAFSLPDNAGSQPASIAVNTLGLHVTGYFNGVSAYIDFDPSVATATLSQVGGEDGFVARYDHCISPSITSSPVSASVCALSNTSFSVLATGNGLTYQWQVNQGAGFSNISNGGVYSGATAATLSLTGPSTGMNNWQYQCVVSGLCSPSATSSIATLTVVGPPTAPLSISGSSLICSGSSIMYSVAVIPSATSYSWTLPTGWSGVSSANLTFATTNTNSGIISVSASNACGTSSATTLSVTVGSPPSLSSIVGSSVICANTIQQYSVSPTIGASSYSWNASGGLVGGSSTTNTIGLSVTSATSGTLTVVASNSCGVSPTRSLVVSINPSPTITVNSGTICAGQSFTMIPSGAISYTYQSGSPVVSPVSTISYSVIGTSSLGCVSAIAAISTITVYSAPSVTVNSGTICSGQSFTMMPSGAISYTFSSGTAVVSPTNTSSFTVTGADALGCVNTSPAISNITVNALPTINASSTNSILCTGQSATLSSIGANTYTWNTTAPTASIVVSPTTTTSYTVLGTDLNGCTGSAVVVQNVSACTSLKEFARSDQVSVFPNPFSNTVSFGWSGLNISLIEIYSAVGDLIYSSNCRNVESAVVDLTQYNNGIYFVRLHETSGHYMNKKLIKQ